MKAKCDKCTLHWCPRCLLNRYGEDVEAVRARAPGCCACIVPEQALMLRWRAGQPAAGLALPPLPRRLQLQQLQKGAYMRASLCHACRWPCSCCVAVCTPKQCARMRCHITYQSWAPQKRGLEATGILAGMSKAAGFTSVSQLLVTNPNAKRPASATAKRPADAPAEAPAPKVAAHKEQVCAYFAPTQQPAHA